jgi:hypothetical protein
MSEFAQNHSSRKRRLRASLFFIFLCISLTVGAHTDRQQELLKGPFYWQKKKEVWEKMSKERFIPVSVTHHAEVWSFKGAGIVEVPKDFMFAETQRYEKLKELPDHFKGVNWDPKTKILSLQVRFISKSRPLKVHIEAEDDQNLFFRIEQGWFQGLEGVLMVREAPDSAKKRSEVGIMAASNENPSWVPNILFSLAAEGVMHHVAQSLRSMAETDYKKKVELKEAK